MLFAEGGKKTKQSDGGGELYLFSTTPGGRYLHYMHIKTLKMLVEFGAHHDIGENGGTPEQ